METPGDTSYPEPPRQAPVGPIPGGRLALRQRARITVPQGDLHWANRGWTETSRQGYEGAILLRPHLDYVRGD